MRVRNHSQKDYFVTKISKMSARPQQHARADLMLTRLLFTICTFP